MPVQPLPNTAKRVKPTQRYPDRPKLRTAKRTPKARKGGFCDVKLPHPESPIDVNYIPGPDLHIKANAEQTWEFLLYHLAYITGCQPASRRVQILAKRFRMRDAWCLYNTSLLKMQQIFGVVPGRYLYDQLHRGSCFALIGISNQANLRTLMDLHPIAPMSTIHRLHMPWRIPLEHERNKYILQPRVVPHLETIWEEDPPKREHTRLPDVYQYEGRVPMRGYVELDASAPTEF